LTREGAYHTRLWPPPKGAWRRARSRLWLLPCSPASHGGKPRLEKAPLALLQTAPRHRSEIGIAFPLQAPSPQAVALEANDQHQQELRDAFSLILQPKLRQPIT